MTAPQPTQPWRKPKSIPWIQFHQTGRPPTTKFMRVQMRSPFHMIKFSLLFPAVSRFFLTSSNTRYVVLNFIIRAYLQMTVGEVRRRLLGPEAFNFSLLGALLRRAKMPEKSKALVNELRAIGLIIPRGRRRAEKVTLMSALTEQEADQLAGRHLFYLISSITL